MAGPSGAEIAAIPLPLLLPVSTRAKPAPLHSPSKLILSPLLPLLQLMQLLPSPLLKPLPQLLLLLLLPKSALEHELLLLRL